MFKDLKKFLGGPFDWEGRKVEKNEKKAANQ